MATCGNAMAAAILAGVQTEIKQLHHNKTVAYMINKPIHLTGHYTEQKHKRKMQ